MDNTNLRGWPIILSPLDEPEHKLPSSNRPVVKPRPYQYNQAMEVESLSQKDDRRHFIIGLCTIVVVLTGLIYGIWALWL